MPLHLRSEDVKKSVAVPAGAFSSAIPKEKIVVYGHGASMYWATFPPHYHTKPHVHDAEQLNYQLEGELWVFINNKAYHVKKGDFLRIPKMAPHWAWNKSDERSTQVEVHIPGMQVDKTNKDIAIGLFDDGEPATTSGSPTNMQAKDFPAEWISVAEAQVT